MTRLPFFEAKTKNDKIYKLNSDENENSLSIGFSIPNQIQVSKDIDVYIFTIVTTMKRHRR